MTTTNGTTPTALDTAEKEAGTDKTPIELINVLRLARMDEFQEILERFQKTNPQGYAHLARIIISQPLKKTATA